MSTHIVDLLIESQDRLDRGDTLRSHFQAQGAAMIESASNSAADPVCQSFLRPDRTEQARGKAATECFVKHPHRVVIRIVTLDAKPHHVDRALVYIFFL